MKGKKIKPLLLIFSVFLCVFVSCGCDAIYGLLQREGAEEKELLGEILPRQRNQQVVKVQKLLKLYGYKVGRVDGILGANTRKAIESFQRDNDLSPTRFVDRATWEQLNIFEPYGLVVDEEVSIYAVQIALREAGLEPGSPDGKFGRRTLIALKLFQEAEGLKPDGKIGIKTLHALSQFLLKQEM